MFGWTWCTSPSTTSGSGSWPQVVRKFENSLSLYRFFLYNCIFFRENPFWNRIHYSRLRFNLFEADLLYSLRKILAKIQPLLLTHPIINNIYNYGMVSFPKTFTNHDDLVKYRNSKFYGENWPDLLSNKTNANKRCLSSSFARNRKMSQHQLCKKQKNVSAAALQETDKCLSISFARNKKLSQQQLCKKQKNVSAATL